MSRPSTAVTTARVPATQTEAQCYQRLRAHLAFLKLLDAAEALPGILDAARHEKLSATATLERFFAVEVTAVEQRRLTSRLRFACLPAPWSLADFDFTAQPGVDQNPHPGAGHPCGSSRPDPTCRSSARPGWARPCSRWGWPAPPSRPGTGSSRWWPH
jgi:hypothetical protein